LGGGYSEAYGINDAGQVVGQALVDASYGGTAYAFLKNPGFDMESLGTLIGGGNSIAYGINNAGQVAGMAIGADGNAWAFLKNPGQPMQSLSTLGGHSYAYGINNTGQVVGNSLDISKSAYQACLWQNGSIYNLNDLTVNLPSGARLEYAWAINDRGWIVGIGTNMHGGFLLTPVAGSAPLGLLLLD
jgi:probable HAF family extracellular repeat protein